MGKKFDWNKRLGKSDKGTSDYLHPAISWCSIIAALAIVATIALITFR